MSSIAGATSNTQSSRACRNCATAKAKCLASLENNKLVCARCIRLKLKCEAQTPKVRKRREPKAVRLGQLENKLDSVLTLLKSTQSSSSHTLPTEPNIPSSTISPPVSLITSPFEAAPRVDVTETSTGSSSKSPYPSDPFVHDEVTLLDVFQTHMFSYFPFIAISTTDLDVLRAHKPFLLATIVLAASRPKVASQSPAARRLLQSFSERCLLDGHASLDLLQAILVYIQWCNYHFINNPQISLLIQMAGALVGELGLNKHQRPWLSRHQQVLAEAGSEDCQDPVAQSHTPEEMRAYLGCFYLSSIIATSLQRVEAMDYTPYIEDCCAALEQRNEHPTDSCLVKLVRTRVIVKRLAQGLPSDEVHVSWNSMTPVRMIVKSLVTELEALSTPDMQDNLPFLLNYHCALVSLYEVGLRKPPLTAVHLNFPHIELRYSCLISTMAYFDTFFLISPDLYFALPSVAWIQLADIMTLSAKLLLIATEGWDLAHARTLCNLDNVFERLENNFEEACAVATRGRASDEDNVDDKFRAYALAMRKGKLAYEMRLASELKETNEVVHTASQPDQGIMGGFEWDENAFWQGNIWDWGNFGNTGIVENWI